MWYNDHLALPDFYSLWIHRLELFFYWRTLVKIWMPEYCHNLLLMPLLESWWIPDDIFETFLLNCFSEYLQWSLSWFLKWNLLRIVVILFDSFGTKLLPKSFLQCYATESWWIFETLVNWNLMTEKSTHLCLINKFAILSYTHSEKLIPIKKLHVTTKID